MDAGLQIVVNGLLIGGVYALAASGLTLVFGVMRIINFAHGEFLMLGGYLAYWMLVLWGWDPLASMPLTMVAVGMLGCMAHRYLVSRVLEGRHLNQILLTLGISIVLQNAALLVFRGDYVTATVSYASSSLAIGSISVGLTRLVAFGLGAGLTLILYLVLHKSEPGRVVRAVAQNSFAAELVGINVQRTYLLTYTASAMLAASAGALSSIIMYVHPMVGFQFIVKAFAIVVLGGLGSVVGSAVAALVLGVIESMVGSLIPGGGGLAEGVAFMVIIATLLVRPKGLFGVE